MKSLTMFVMTLSVSMSASASIALACPDLAGTYTCQVDVSSYKLTVSQNVLGNGVTVYAITDNEGTTQAPADNIEYPYDDPNQNLTGTVRFTCEGPAFKSYFKGQVTDGSSRIIQAWDVVRRFQLNAEGDLEDALSGTLIEDGQKHAFEDTLVCLKLI